MFGTVEAQARQEGYNVFSPTLEHTLSLTDDVDMVKLREQSGTGRVDTADHRAASVSQVLQQGDTL